MADTEPTETTATKPEGEPKRPPKKSSPPAPADDTNIEVPEYGPIIAEITPAGWFIFLGTILAGVAIYIYVQKRRQAGKSIIPGPPQQQGPRIMQG